MNMNIFSCLSLFIIVISSAADCGPSGKIKPGQPQLIMTVADKSNAGTDNYVYGNVLAGKRLKTATWAGWQRLWDSNCNNFERGDTNVFDDFIGVTDEWFVIALYICGSDGVAITTIQYWNGQEMAELDYFCANVVGLDGQKKCFTDGNEITDQGTCYNTGQSIYNLFWVDGDEDCQAVTIQTNFKSTTGTPVGVAYIKSIPGLPDCSKNELEAHLFDDVEGELSVDSILYENMTYSNIIILAIIIGVLSISGLAYICWKKNYDHVKEYKPLLS